MSFRIKVLLSITLTVVVAVWAVAWVVSASITKAFEQRDSQRTATLLAQFRREFARRGEEVARRVEAIARSESVARLASSPEDSSQYLTEAQTLAAEQSLDFLELVAADGSIISSAQWPARFGYKEAWMLQPVDWKAEGFFLKREDLADGAALGLMTVRSAASLYVVGGQRLGKQFVESLDLPEGMRVELESVASAPPEQREITRIVGDETVTTIPQFGRDHQLLAILRVTNSRRELLGLANTIRQTAVAGGAGGVLLGVVLSFWVASRVTRPLRQLAASVRQVSQGAWNARAPVESNDEIGQLARDFNHMTGQLVDQKERMIQAERVAAWRELARRLAHELKNPLFPLQITIENLQRARERSPEQFDEVFRESTATLLTELENLKTITSRFSDFARMPAPEMEPVDLNQIVRDMAKLFEARFHEPGRPPIACELDLDPSLPVVSADPDQLRRALRNLVLNAMDAMPAGGTLRIRTKRGDDKVSLEVSDSGEGLTKEECERLFTPYYTTKQHGTGLGLAIVQSVVSDHGGAIAVESEPGKGATFRIELKP